MHDNYDFRTIRHWIVENDVVAVRDRAKIRSQVGPQLANFWISGKDLKQIEELVDQSIGG